MPHPSRYIKKPETSTKEMKREWMASQMEANKRMKNQGDVKFIEEDETQPILTFPNPNLINSNSPTISSFLKDYTVHIPYTNAKMFADDVLPNHVGDEELNSIDGVGTGKMTKKNDNGMPKELNKEWKLNDKTVPYNKEVYHYLWHPTEIPHLNRIIKES
ncbi:hypothetical protein Tco_1447990 [Tanacetum coccineum]